MKDQAVEFADGSVQFAGGGRQVKTYAQRGASGMAKVRQKRPTSAKAKSIIESTRIHLGLPRPPAEAAKPADHHDAMAEWHRVDLHVQQQNQDNWCWAAVATSVALFYDSKSKWTQCGVATRQVPGRDCCGVDADGACNVPGHLQQSLSIVGHASKPPYVEEAASFAKVQREVDGGRPICVRTVWSGGRGHFLCIVGYRTMFEMLAFEDPLWGKSTVGYSTFCTDYHHAGGSWTDTYFTKS
jgi:hypothetical protein